MAVLEYTIMFDPSETWPHLHQFEGFLSKSLDSIGMEAEILNPVGGQLNKSVLYIKKKGVLGMSEPNIITGKSEEKPKIGRPKSIKGRMKEFQQRDVRTPAKEFMSKEPHKKLKGFDRIMRKAVK
jgi:hypothetical protein